MDFFNKFNKLKNKAYNSKLLLASLTVGILGMLSLTIGSSFAYLTYQAEAEEVNIVRAGSLLLEFLDSTNNIYMEKALPQLDSDAIENNSEYTFNIKNTGTIQADYIVSLANVCKVGQSVTTNSKTITPQVCIPLDYVRVGVKVGNGVYEVKELTDNKFVLDKGTIEAKGSSDTIRFKIWLSSDTPDDYQGIDASGNKRTVAFIGQLEIQGAQIGVLDTSENLASKIIARDLKTSGDTGLFVTNETNTGKPSYYYKGAVDNNYVELEEKTGKALYRIVRINEDGSVRLIRQDGIDNNTTYAFNPDASTYEKMYYSNSNVEGGIMKRVNDWYTSSIEGTTTASSVIESTFCEQAKTTWYNNSGSTLTAGSQTMTPVTNEYVPTLKCVTDANGKGLLNMKVGLLTADEVIMAGYPFYTTTQTNNTSVYLQIGNFYWWTMSPSGFNSSSAGVWSVYDSGIVHFYSVHSNNNRLRPTLSIVKTAKVTGLGTASDPFKLKLA